MGLFGKSKKQKEREEEWAESRRKSDEERRAREAAETQVYNELLTAMERIQRMSPEWQIQKYEEFYQSHGSYDANVFAKLSKSLRVEINIMYRAREIYARIKLKETEENGSIYYNYFSNGKLYYGATTRNSKACEYLRNYVKGITDAEKKRKEDEAAAKQQKLDAIKDQFWNS